jgi:hypothetical protein
MKNTTFPEKRQGDFLNFLLDKDLEFYYLSIGGDDCPGIKTVSLPYRPANG